MSICEYLRSFFLPDLANIIIQYFPEDYYSIQFCITPNPKTIRDPNLATLYEAHYNIHNFLTSVFTSGWNTEPPAIEYVRSGKTLTEWVQDKVKTLPITTYSSWHMHEFIGRDCGNRSIDHSKRYQIYRLRMRTRYCDITYIADGKEITTRAMDIFHQVFPGYRYPCDSIKAKVNLIEMKFMGHETVNTSIIPMPITRG